MLKQAFVFLMIIVSSAGCAQGIGARRLPIDRKAYLEALGNSWKDQLLYNIVKLRYGEAPTYLDVSSISQAYTLEFDAGANYTLQTGTTTWGPEPTGTTGGALAIWPRNIFGFSAAVRRQTAPTVTYTPITGEAIKASLIEPIPTDDMCKALQTGWLPEFVLPLTVRSINNLRNRPSENPDFIELVKIWKTLSHNGALRIAFEEITKTEAPALEGKEGKKKGKADKWDETADSLAKFSSRLVKEQNKQCDEKIIAPFVILDTDPKRDKTHEVPKFKKLLDLVEHPEHELIGKFLRFLPLYEPFEPNVMKWLTNKGGLTTEQINNNRDALREFLGYSTGLTNQEQDKLRAIMEGGSHIEKYRVVSDVPHKGTGPVKHKESGLDKIYLNTCSITQVLTTLSLFVDVPPSDIDKIDKKSLDEAQRWKDWFKELNVHVDIRWMSSGIMPELLDRPKEFAAVMYKGNWFYVADDDYPSKDVLSGVIGIFTMMPVGKPATAPVLTLPVR